MLATRAIAPRKCRLVSTVTLSVLLTLVCTAVSAPAGAARGSAPGRDVFHAAAWSIVTANAGPHIGHAAAPIAADCQPFSGRPCLLPFPDDLFTRADRSTPTGRRVNLPVAAMPVNTHGQRIAVTEYDRSDGFSPGSALIVHVAGLDSRLAFDRTGLVTLANMSTAFARRQPIVVIDERTGARQLIWSELDANATGAQNTDLLIHPGRNFTEGDNYAVALRNLRTATGRLIAAPSWFERLRDGRRLPVPERAQAGRYAKIFAVLERAGIARANLYEAWDFTVESSRSETSRMLEIRNDAFSQLGDPDLADGRVQGRAPSFSVTSVSQPSSAIRIVQGTVDVPCYLKICGPSATAGFHYSSRRPDALPTQIRGNLAAATFECVIPSSAGAAHPARISLYGHGLLGSSSEVEAGNVEAMATEHNMVFCASDLWGLAQGDVPGDISALENLNLFPAVIDRLQQGVLNMLYLGRAMLHPRGFAANAAFRVAGRPLIDTSHLYYDGNSQGGIMGGMITAVAPDFRRAVLGVSGMNYGGVLLERSTDFADYEPFVFTSYADPSLHPVVLDLMQQLWDRGEADGYAQQMTTHPLPDTPSHTVLMQIAYGDHQVSMYAAAIEARTIGAAVHEPALDLSTDRARDRNLFYGVPAITHYPFHGSAIEIWDSGPGRVAPPPLANLAPVNSKTNADPHQDPRSTALARVQKSDFLKPNGAVINVCGDRPCRTSVYTP
jgi:hypothetical protein